MNTNVRFVRLIRFWTGNNGAISVCAFSMNCHELSSAFFSEYFPSECADSSRHHDGTIPSDIGIFLADVGSFCVSNNFAIPAGTSSFPATDHIESSRSQPPEAPLLCERLPASAESKK